VREAGDAPKTYVARNTKRRFAGVNPVSSQLFALCEWMCVRFFLLFKGTLHFSAPVHFLFPPPAAI